MNESIKQILQIDAQLSAILRMLSRNEFLGAGLTISVNVGPLGEDHEPDIEHIQVGITGEPEALLRLLHRSLAQSRMFWVSNARSELKELQAAVEQLEDERP